MKNRMISLIYLAFTSILLVSCSNNVTPSPKEEPPYVETDNYLVFKGVSDYQIIIPNSANANIAYAANELSDFIYKSSGARLPIVSEDNYYPDSPYIALGDTAQAFIENIEKPVSYNYNNSGYYIKSHNNNLFILDNENAHGEGCLYGVYDYLNLLIGFEVYSSDEIKYEEKEDIKFYDIDEVVIPSFDLRSLGYAHIVSDLTYQKRMRLTYHGNDSRWALFGHTQASPYFDILKPSIYFESHSDWFSSTGDQINYMAGEEMEDEVAKNLFENYVIKYPDAQYFMLGQEDNSKFCDCDECLRAMEENKCGIAGLQIIFLNHVVEKVEALMAEDIRTQNREINYVFFAYNSTVEPPVLLENDRYVPSSTNVIPHEKLCVLFAPIGMNFAQDFDNSVNASTYEYLLGWEALCPNRVMVYIYDINFYNYLINFNNFDSVKSIYTKFYEHGVNYLYSQGPLDTETPGLCDMRIYVESKLMWDTSLDYSQLVDDFMLNYYRDASNAMRDYYDITRSRYTYYMEAINSQIGGIYSPIGTSDIWDLQTVFSLQNSLNSAISNIEKYQIDDPSLYSKLYYRIKREQITVSYLLLSYYSSYFSENEVNDMIHEFRLLCEYFHITKSVEGGEGLPF